MCVHVWTYNDRKNTIHHIIQIYRLLNFHIFVTVNKNCTPLWPFDVHLLGIIRWLNVAKNIWKLFFIHNLMFYDFKSSHYSQNSASYVQLKFRISSPLRGNQPPKGHETLPKLLIFVPNKGCSYTYYEYLLFPLDPFHPGFCLH